MYCKKFIDTDEVKQTLLKKGAIVPSSNTLPSEIISPGLFAQHLWYLYEQICEFVAEKFQDSVAPRPLIDKLKPEKAATYPTVPDSEVEDETLIKAPSKHWADSREAAIGLVSQPLGSGPRPLQRVRPGAKISRTE